MKKRILCDITASIYVYVDIPKYLINTFEKYDEFNSWESDSNPDKENCEEIYELINDQICNNINKVDWQTILILNEEDIEE